MARATTPRELKQAIRDSIAALPARDATLGGGGAYTRTCTQCGRTGTRGFTSRGHTFALRGRTRTAQRLNMNSGPCTWECAPGHGCRQEGARGS